MANANAPRGLIPYAEASGAPYSGSGNVYYIPSSNATALFVGDPVTLLGTSDANGVPGIEIATAGNNDAIIGSIVGITNNAGELVIPVLQSSPVYVPASTAAYVLVADDPGLVFSIQESANAGTNSAGSNANLLSGSGSTVTGYSGWQLNSASVATTQALQLKILRLLQQIDNAVGTNAKWLVKINQHLLANNTAGV